MAIICAQSTFIATSGKTGKVKTLVPIRNKDRLYLVPTGNNRLIFICDLVPIGNKRLEKTDSDLVPTGNTIYIDMPYSIYAHAVPPATQDLGHEP